MRIKSVRDKRLAKLIENPTLKSVKGFDPAEVRKVVDMLAAISVMTDPNQLRAVPGWKAHELTPGYRGKWSLRVTPNYRLTFYVDDAAQTVSFLDYEDYH